MVGVLQVQGGLHELTIGLAAKANGMDGHGGPIRRALQLDGQGLVHGHRGASQIRGDPVDDRGRGRRSHTEQRGATQQQYHQERPSGVLSAVRGVVRHGVAPGLLSVT